MSKFNSMSKILFQMTGSIACYKACGVISKLVQNGFEVQVVASRAALQFVGAATLEGLTGKAVVQDTFEQGHMMDHINLVRWADLIITAPASANFINKAAQGIGDDLVLTQFLAHDFKKPYLMAPAMNTMMYLHPATQSSIQKLRAMGISILETASGVLACGEVGWGRLLEPELIFQEIVQVMSNKIARSPTAIEMSLPKKILITSGGTQEFIDPVRFITNKSTGKTGAQLAETLIQFGYDVTYLHADNAAQPLSPCEKLKFTDFASLQEGLESLLTQTSFEAVIHAAAVSDYSLKESNSVKISSEADTLKLELKRNPKLIDTVKKISKNKGVKLIGFKLTSGRSPSQIQENIEKIFNNSHADIIVHNDLSEMSEQHLFHIYKDKKKIQSICGANILAHYFGEILMEDLK